VVTGGTGALGAGVVQALSAAGATCHVTRREEVDLADEAAVERWYAARPAPWASIHLAGGFAMSPITETRLADLRAQLDVNLVTAFLACREAVRAMRRAGSGGRIVNVASRPAIVPAGGMIAYSVSKAAVASLTQSLAVETKRDGILVNAVLPSTIDTPQNRAAMPKADFDAWPKPAEIAEAILWLASPRNTLVSGALVPVW
jgi:NAD(P)-dependent dehydrogenase (short-subunit alcohol dehydrogenase family)